MVKSSLKTTWGAHLKNLVIRCKSEELFLLLQALGIITVLFYLGWLSPRYYPDSIRFTDFHPASLQDALNSIAPPGYPLTVQLIRKISPKLTLLPLFHVILHLIAIFVLYYGLLAYNSPRKLACLATSTLLYVQPFLRMSGAVLSDSPAFSLTILVLGLVFYIAGKGIAPSSGLALMLAIVAAWQTRSTGIFMVVYVPLALSILCYLRGVSWRRLFLISSALTIIPLGGYITLRKIIVDHAGVAPFFGSSLIGISFQLLDDDDIAQFKGKYKKLAYELRIRMHKQGWRPPVPKGMHMIIPARIAYAYNSLIWQNAPDAAEKIMGTGIRINGKRHIEYEKIMTHIGIKAVCIRPGRYLQWILMTFGNGIGQQFILSPLLIILPAYFILTIITQCNIASSQIQSQPANCTQAERGIQFLSILFFCFYMLLIASVQYAQPRYTLAAGGVLPMAAVTALLKALRILK